MESLNLLTGMMIPGSSFVSDGMNRIVTGEGPILSFVGMGVVFAGLVILTLFLYSLEKIVDYIKLPSATGHGASPGIEEGHPSKPAEQKKLTGEEAIAICTALVLYNRLHMDEYRQKLTIGPSKRPVSAWALSGRAGQWGMIKHGK